MAGFIQCNYGGGGGPVEVITGHETGTAGSTFTVTSQQGKAPKRINVWREDGTNAFSMWNVQRSGYCLISNYNNGAAWTAVGSAYANCCNVKTIGSTSVEMNFPSVAAYSTGKEFYYSVEFE